MKPRLIGIAVAAVMALGLAAAIAARPRVDPREVDRFVERAREGTRRYENHQAAIEDGFTRVGAEFPAMGEHWVSFARIMEDTFAAERPSVLIYVSSDTGRRLAGVAYTRFLKGNSSAPDFPRARAWHEHNGAVDEESLPLRHASHAIGAADDSSAPRLAILHAWIWNDNPRGLFETDNWALPLERAGIRGSLDLPRGAVQALALADDRDGYLMLILRTGIDLTPAEDSAASAVVAVRRGRMGAITRQVRASGRVDAGQTRALEEEWSSLWAELEQAVPNRRAEVRSLHGRM
jgi:hypothetical protein